MCTLTGRETPSLTHFLKTIWHKSVPQGSPGPILLDALLTWNSAFKRMRVIHGGYSGQVSHRITSLSSIGAPMRHSSCRQKGSGAGDSRRGPRMAERPLFSLTFQSKHLEKYMSKCGYFNGAAGEQSKNMFC